MSNILIANENKKSLNINTTDVTELNIVPQNGFIIDLENSDLSVGKIVFKKKESQLPTTWEDLKKLDGFYVESNSEIGSISGYISTINRNVFPTKEEAEACLALSQLCQLRDAYNGEPLADWCDWANSNQKKYCIIIHKGEIYKDNYVNLTKILSFKTGELRDKFVKNFEDLILTAKPLL